MPVAAVRVRWYPSRSCADCGGLGFVPVVTENGKQAVTKCGCWWKWSSEDKARQVRDGKAAASGE